MVNSISSCATGEADNDDDVSVQRAYTLQSASCEDDDGDLSSDNPEILGSHSLKASADLKDYNEDDDGDDDDDDSMQWANSRRPLEITIQSFSSGDCMDLHVLQTASGKENKVEISRSSVSWVQRHAGPVRPNSVPIPGSLKGAAKQRMAPSIIPVNLRRKKLLGYDICEPMSPEVTCLGRIKIKEANDTAARTTTGEKPVDCAATQRSEKGRCFDTKNQLCGKRVKGREKKKTAENSRCLSRKKRVASKEVADHSQGRPSSVSTALEETRRERAACLARSLTDLLVDVRRHEKERIKYEPSVPPPNSLLLMRGCRRMDESYSPLRPNIVEEATGNVDVCAAGEAEALTEESSDDSDVNNFSNNVCAHVSLLDLIDREDDDLSTSEIEDTISAPRTSRAKVQVRGLRSRGEG